MKYENLAVVTKAFGDYKTLCFVSGNSKAEIIRKVKNDQRLNVRMNGIIYIDDPNFTKGINSNLL